MTRSRPLDWRFLLAVLLGPSGCALSDGDPFGIAEVELGVHLEIPEDRRLEDGRFKTSSGYQVRIDQWVVVLDELSLEISGATETVSFDPANPPPGYSLCHNGHCHADDGRLVDYEDIVAELAGGAGAGKVQVEQALSTSPIEVSANATPVALGACEDGCALARGELSACELGLRELSVRARIFDGVAAERARLPGEGLRVILDDEDGFQIRHALNARIDVHEPLVTHLSVELHPSVRLFDGIDWASYTSSTSTTTLELERHPALEAQVHDNLERFTELFVETSRSDETKEER